MEIYNIIKKKNFNIPLTSSQKKSFYAMLFVGMTHGAKMLYDNYKCQLEFICGDEKFKKDVIDNCPSLSAGVYYPTIYLPTPTMQLVYGGL
jgi:hypothetical protein